jgi:hypothetical protein
LRAIYTLLLCAAAVAAGAATRPTRAPRYAYLPYNSPSLAGVIKQVQNSPKLQQRYAKHFGIPASQVVRHFRYHLMESYIPQTKVYDVWCVKPDGTRFVVKQRFVKGTRVLALRNGQPVMKWACGNPLSRKFPEIKEKVVRVGKTLPNVEDTPVTVRVDVPFEPLRELPAVPPDYSVPSSGMSFSVQEPSLPPPTHARRFFVPPIIPPGGGDDDEPPVIPEPATLVLLAAGGAAGALLCRRR